MNTNHDFQIGKEHVVCQDYAISGVMEGIPFAIVCDGCSASPDTDLGARLMAIGAKEQLSWLYHVNSYASFGLTALKRAVEACLQFPSLHAQVLDVTLLVAFVQGDQLTVFMYGDGVCYYKVNGREHFIHVSYETHDEGVIKTAPDYLSYTLSHQRMEAYCQKPTVKLIETDGSLVRVNAFAPVVLELPVQPGDIVALSSDGIDSFRNATNDSIPWQDIAKEFFGYKQTNGVFVNRRLSAFKRHCLKEGISHSDDISVAAIAL